MSEEQQVSTNLNFKYVSLRTVVQAQIGVTPGGIVGSMTPKMVVFEGPAPQEQIQGIIDNLKATGYLMFHAAENYLLFAKEDSNDSQNGQRHSPRLGVEAGPWSGTPGVPDLSGTGGGSGESTETSFGQQSDTPTRPNLTLLEGGAGKPRREEEDEGGETD